MSIIKKECTVGHLWYDENNPSEIYYSSGKTEDGYIFKDKDAFESGNGICYIAESDLNDWKVDMELSDVYIPVNGYTRQDFMDLCDGVEAIASSLFNGLSWAHPETLLDGWYNDCSLIEWFSMISGSNDYHTLEELAEKYISIEGHGYDIDFMNFCTFLTNNGLITDNPNRYGKTRVVEPV